jgi:hypothetical protein
LNFDEIAISSYLNSERQKLACIEQQAISLGDAVSELVIEPLSDDAGELRASAVELRLRAQQAAGLSQSLSSLAACLEFAAQLQDCARPPRLEAPTSAKASASSGGRRRS